MAKKTMPTMKDVAREAGVALGTVSRVFNGLQVGEEYKKKVEEAADRLGYQVNPLARGLKTNKTNVIAVIVPNTTHPYYAAIANDLGIALAKRGCHMMLFLSGANHQYEQSCIQMVRQNKVDGIIGLTYNMVDVHQDIPFISIDRHFHAGVPCVASDNYGGGRLAAEKLIENGCRKLLAIRIGSDLPSEADKRVDGFATGCALLDTPCDVMRMNDIDDKEIFIKHFLSHTKDGQLDYDGIFCCTDWLALHIRSTLEALGHRVPEDVQIIGFDGIRRFDTQDYYVSTFVQPTDKIAETCVDLILREDRANVPSLVCLPVSYAYGGTTRE